ncbi:Sodium/calcium exchanger protein-domain-containing protein [Pseudomassariella vexata]|uniref:Sodium/calcium exchanger protein-domain-containing protein n=1 Tax=Pseudomassariella vexata TaxID=1141098 RepID=A0A1Y2E4Y1_9PEZI|nr:Sodium/calcium exchanger protein-domain-containing protein [Pseudomassariella vexata]ORY65915.1 Sodium/calcium exchanger protein-domain-containing protein [Pseudomassariella vexata]
MTSSTMPSAAVARGRRFSSRPFFATVFCITLLAVYSIFIRDHAANRDDAPLLHTRSGEDCRLVHQAADQCAFVKRNCHDDEAGLIEYLAFYYCTLGNAQPLGFIILVMWLGLLFTTIGIAASDFFSVNLSTIATILGLSESLAGVTFLAFGNGSPDVFSTFAAMSSNSGSMAVGELIGAAGFITSVVAGSMALVREFKVSRKTFVRDICFFIVAVAFSVGFLSDGHIHLWECCVMIGFYVFYVIVVVGWHAYAKRKQARRAREVAARGHFHASGSSQGQDELEPYRDEPGDEDTTPGASRGAARAGPATVDIGILDRAPRIEIGQANDDNEDDDEAHGQHVAAEVTSSMRVNRPRGRRSTTTITPIRPSLIGALEFRSVLSSLQQERNMCMAPIHTRSHSADRLSVGLDDTRRTMRGSTSWQTIPGAASTTRNRTQSSAAVLTLTGVGLKHPPSASADERGRARSPSTHTVGGRLAPPRLTSGGTRLVEGYGEDSASRSKPSGGLRVRIPSPSPQSSAQSSPAMSPFPRYTDSPLPLAANPHDPSQLMLPTSGLEQRHSFPTLPQQEDPKPVRWWPYEVLPAPHVLISTLFPTLQDWKNKLFWDKLVRLVSVPSIFLLAITVPVVESDTTDDDSDMNVEEQPASGHLGNTAAAVSHESNGSIESETEWQRYRRRTRSRGSSVIRTSSVLSLAAPDETPGSGSGSGSAETVRPARVALDAQPVKPSSELGQDSSAQGGEEQGWNRWLLILQIFTGPLFSVFIVWANMADDLEQPGLVLIRALLISLVFSLVLLGILLLTTSPDRRPKFHFMFCFLGFIIAIAWISTIAGEVVGVLKTIGVILNISEAILGLTVFAVGNSVGDLVADITVARLGYPVMALSACFGGPMLNILLGIGLGGAYQTIHAADKKHRKHPDRPIQYKPYHIQVGGTLLVSAVVLLVTLLVLLIAVPMNKWVMSRKIGWGLVALWLTGTIINLVIESTGLWLEIA